MSDSQIFHSVCVCTTVTRILGVKVHVMFSNCEGVVVSLSLPIYVASYPLFQAQFSALSIMILDIIIITELVHSYTCTSFSIKMAFLISILAAKWHVAKHAEMFHLGLKVPK